VSKNVKLIQADVLTLQLDFFRKIIQSDCFVVLKTVKI